MRRQTIPTSFQIPAEIKLKELERAHLSKPAAKMIADSLAILFAYSPESFPKQLRDTIIKHVRQAIPGSLDVWMEAWSMRDDYMLPSKKVAKRGEVSI